MFKNKIFCDDKWQKLPYKTQPSFDFASRNKNYSKLEYIQIITKPNKAHHHKNALLDMSKIHKIVIKDAWTWIKFQ